MKLPFNLQPKRTVLQTMYKIEADKQAKKEKIN